MNSEKNFNSYKTLLMLSLFLLPYDAMNVLPTTYAPVSLFILALIILLNMIDTKLKVVVYKTDILLLIFTLYAFLSSLITSMHNVGNYNFLLNQMLTYCIGVMSYMAFCIAFNKLSVLESVDTCIDMMMRIISKAYYIPFFVGIIEYAAIKGVLPYNIKTMLNSIFGGWQTRLCMTTSEASWVSMQMLISFAANYYLYKKKKNKKYIVLMLFSIFFFFIASSLQGIVTLLVALVIYIFLNQFRKNNAIFFLKDIFKIVLVGALGIFIFYKLLSLNPNTYFSSRVLHFTSLKNALLTDSSVYVRVGYLILHLLMFIDNPIFGIGVGSFFVKFKEYTLKYFPQAGNLPEISMYLINNNANTETSIYFSIISELGIIGIILFGIFMKNTLDGLKNNYNNCSNEFVFFIAVLLSLPIQFGSWAYIPFWMGLAILAVMGRRQENGK